MWMFSSRQIRNRVIDIQFIQFFRNVWIPIGKMRSCISLNKNNLKIAHSNIIKLFVCFLLFFEPCNIIFAMTHKSKKNILVLFCGGTISMHKNEKTGALDVAHGADQFFKLEPRIVELANIDVHFIDNLDSTNMTHVQWEKIVNEIKKEYHNYDGFLITQGTNTLA